jgi:TRAP-type C4-dicarboxylate transport system permease small subunit
MIEKRDLVLYIVLSIITCGIFSLYWFVCITDDTNKLLGETDTSGIVSLLLTIVTCGIYGFYWAYREGEKIDRAKQRRNIPAGNGGILYVILYFFGGLIAYALIQNELNNLA